MLFLTSCVLAWSIQAEAPLLPSGDAVVVGDQEPAKSERPAEAKQEPGKNAESQAERKRGESRPRMSREEAQRWWEGLSEEEKQKARERMQRFREMKPDAQKELARRTELLRTVGKQVIAEMTAEQRASFDKLPGEERARVHQALVRKKLAECGENVENWEAPSSDRPLEDRLRHSQEQRDQWRKKRTERDLERAVEDGWISQKAAEQLRKGSSEALDARLDQVRQWRMIEWFDEKGVWENMGIDAAARERIIALEPKPFFEEMRKHSDAQRGTGERGTGERGGRRSGGRRPDGPPREGEGPPAEGGPPPPGKGGTDGTTGTEGGGKGGGRHHRH
jgi:hypothetical protein